MAGDAVGARRPRRVFVVAATLVAAAVLGTLESSAHNGAVLSGWGTATIDGRMAAGEWDGAARVEAFAAFPGGARPVTILVMNDDSRSYFALRVARPTLAGDEGVDFHFDNRHDGNNGDLGEEILRLTPSQGAVDMYYDPSVRTIFPDVRDGGSNDIEGRVLNDGAASFFEVAHPLDTADDAHDFSLRPGSRAGFSISYNTCFCPEERVSGWPPPGPWADVLIARAPSPRPRPGTAPRLGLAVVVFTGAPPRAGRSFGLRVVNVRLRGTSTWATPDGYTCAAQVARAALRGRGSRRCSWTIPRGSAGETLRIRVRIRYHGASRTARFAFRVE